MEKNLLGILSDLPPMSSTKLDDQIKYMESVNRIFSTPIAVSIIHSLKELKAIKNKTTNV